MQAVGTKQDNMLQEYLRLGQGKGQEGNHQNSFAQKFRGQGSDQFGFILKRSCLSEIRLQRTQKEPTLIGLREPQERQLQESRAMKP